MVVRDDSREANRLGLVLGLTVALVGCMDSAGTLPVGDVSLDTSVPDSDAWLDVDGDSPADAGCISDEDCDDSNPCTDDTCLEDGECGHEPNTDPCDDGNVCTDPDVCADGTCQPGPGVCQCETSADCEPFDDDDLCNGSLWCDVDLCIIDPATIVICPAPATVCAPLVCQPATGVCEVEPAEEATPCEDEGNLCTEDTCDADGVCQHGTIDCDDDEQCTDDSCHPSSGCVYTTISGFCDDGDICTDGDVCFGGHCTPGGPLDCEDGDLCTTHTCAHPGGCEQSFNTLECYDGDPCTGPDTCDGAGSCTPGPAVAVWYLDDDGDDYGLTSDAVCSPTRPAGYAPDDGDCCDGLDHVNPGQTSYFYEPYYCPGGTGSTEWDYDCDGSISQRWVVRGDCDRVSSSVCDTTPGWRISSWDPIPGCGDVEEFITACSGSTCNVSASDDRAQQCR